MDCLLHVFRSAQIPNFKHAIFTVSTESVDFIDDGLQEILGALQVSDAGSVELSAFDDVVACTTEDGRLVEVRLPGRLSSVSEECAHTFLDYLKPGTLRIAVELDDQNRIRWLTQVLERNNVVELRVRLGRETLQSSRAVIDYLALFEEETEEQAEGKSGLPLPSLQALALENGVVDIPHLLRMVESRVNAVA
ncbi:hypothetical protein FRC01_003567 [Tulasnella sp. 417]|nr:hypothetical protein FRC01_003567 [Tulasnella sp. 417]